MKNLLKDLLEKLCCKHDWQIVSSVKYIYYWRYLLICKKCGKIKTKRV